MSAPRLVLIAAAVLACWAAAAADLTGRASVIDGDTLEIHGQRIRLFGIDAQSRGRPDSPARSSYSRPSIRSRIIESTDHLPGPRSSR